MNHELAGLSFIDRETANLAVGHWLREVANVRVHVTTGEIPAQRLAIERMQLQPLPTPYAGRSVRSLQKSRCRHRSSACSTRCRFTTRLVGGVR